MLGRLSNIVHLQIPMSELCPFDTTERMPWFLESTLRFNFLEEITFRHPDLCFALSSMSSWSLPRLKRVNLVDDSWFMYSPGLDKRRQPTTKMFTRFFSAHAATIKELAFSPRYSIPIQEAVKTVIHLLRSSLEYVVLPLTWQQIPEILSILPVDDNPTRIHVDLWGFRHSLQHPQYSDRDIANFLFGADKDQLRPNVRILDATLSHIWGLIRYFPHTGRPPLDSPMVHNHFGVHIVDTHFALFPLGSKSLNVWQDVLGAGGLRERFVQGRVGFQD